MGGATPRSLPADFQILRSRGSVSACLAFLRSRDGFDRLRLLDLLRHAIPPGTALYQISDAALLEQAIYLMSNERLCVGRYRQPFGEIGLPKSVRLAEEQEDRARGLGAAAPAHAAPVLKDYEIARKPANPLTGAPEQDIRVAVFEGTGYAPKAGLPNETDATCPAKNHRSESTTTCSPAVNQWFVDKQVAMPRRDESLGIIEGGGFVRFKTTVKHLPAGTPLYRYVDSATWPWGGWWFLEPLNGNPCVLAALPENSAASVMVQAHLKKDLDVLYGPGAPRCSNKPGGPEQVLIAHCDFNPASGDVLKIVG